MKASPLRISIATLVVAVMASVSGLYAWWYSTEHYVEWTTRSFQIRLMASAISFHLGDLSGNPHQILGYNRGLWGSSLPEDNTLFPPVRIAHGFLEFPIWFLICTFFSALFFLWFFLMKRIKDQNVRQ